MQLDLFPGLRIITRCQALKELTARLREQIAKQKSPGREGEGSPATSPGGSV